MEAGVVRHHLEVVEAAEAAEGEEAQALCHSVGVQAEGQVFREAAVAEGQVQPADQREEEEGEAVRAVQLK